LKIIILGAGQVGATLAENLASEANDITVVDTDRFRLRALQDRLDIRTIHGNASYPDILKQAGGIDADMLIAVTNSDEINMVACQISHALFRTPTKIARVRSPAYDGDDDGKTNPLFGGKTAFNIDQIIRPEQLVTEAIFQHQIRKFLERHGDAHLTTINGVPGLDTLYGTQRLPTHAGGDGFFYALLVKSEPTNNGVSA